MQHSQISGNADATAGGADETAALGWMGRTERGGGAATRRGGGGGPGKGETEMEEESREPVQGELAMADI